MKVIVILDPSERKALFDMALRVEVPLPNGSHLSIERLDGETAVMRHTNDGEPAEIVWSEVDAQ